MNVIYSIVCISIILFQVISDRKKLFKKTTIKCDNILILNYNLSTHEKQNPSS